MFSIVMDMSTNPAAPALTWAQFAIASPGLATEVRALFEQYGKAFGYLATSGEGIDPIAEGRSERVKTLIDPWAETSRARAVG